MRAWLISLIASLVPALAWGATIVVSPSGSDGSPCTAAAPCRTLNYGASRLSPGDTLLAKPGTYAETLDNVLPGGARLVSETPGGAIMAPGEVNASGIITIRSSNVTVEGMVVDAAGTNGRITNLVFIAGGASNVTLNGLEIRNLVARDYGSWGGSGIDVEDGSDRVTVRNSYIHDISYGFQNNHVHGMYISGTNGVYECNHIARIEAYGVQQYTNESSANGNTYRQNVIHDSTTRDAMYLSSGAGTVARANVMWNTGAGIRVEGGGVTLDGNQVLGAAPPNVSALLAGCATALPAPPPQIKLPAPRNLRLLTR